MRCPKCSAEQSDSNVECARCGIVFARWRATQERMRPEAAPTPAPVADDAPIAMERTIPRWVVIAGVIAFVTLGIMWTSSHRSARASGTKSMDDMLNEINQQGTAAKNKIAADGARMQRGQPPENPKLRKWWDWAISGETFPVESGTAGAVNADSRKKPKTMPVRIGLPVLNGYVDLYDALEAQGSVTVEKDQFGRMYPRFTSEGKRRADAHWNLKSSTEWVSEWEVPVGYREIIDVIAERQDGSAVTLTVSFRWHPTAEGKRLGYRTAGPFKAIVQAQPGQNGLMVEWRDPESRFPAGGPDTLTTPQ